MELEEENELALCKCFEVALVGPASSWYNCLFLDSSGSFRELVNKFSTHFTVSMRSSKRAIQMIDIIQKPDESIREIVERVNR